MAHSQFLAMKQYEVKKKKKESHLIHIISQKASLIVGSVLVFGNESDTHDL